jgi:methylated-DNA-[protein]-cysteine S-methyltransferase
VELERAEIQSPIGRVTLVAREGALCALAFGGVSAGLRRVLERRFGRFDLRAAAPTTHVRSHIEAYFGGDLDAVDGLEVDLGGTPFQRRVWSALRELRPGKTASYQDLAAELGSPSAARAVGSANGMNPVALVVPCHRVIRSDGDLGGYAYGLERKRWLLEHEGAL